MLLVVACAGDDGGNDDDGGDACLRMLLPETSTRYCLYPILICNGEDEKQSGLDQGLHVFAVARVSAFGCQHTQSESIAWSQKHPNAPRGNSPDWLGMPVLQ